MADGMGALENPLVELRGMAPRELVDVLDAVSTARRISRNELVVEVLRQWADQRVHEATLLSRVLRCNPQATEPERKWSQDRTNGGLHG